jgi:methionine synthase I (cobalamin-dependent)
VFARRLAGSLGSEHLQMIAQKHRTDREFRDTVDRYVQQFEALLEHTARNDRDNVLVETYLASQTGKVYMTLATATGRLS